MPLQATSKQLVEQEVCNSQQSQVESDMDEGLQVQQKANSERYGRIKSISTISIRTMRVTNA